MKLCRLFTLLLLGWAGPLLAATPAAKPNILIILADDLGYSDLGSYGGEIATPNLDALAEGGLRFSQFYNSGRCWPSRAALMTGYYPQQVRRDKVEGVRAGTQGIRPRWAPLITEYLRPASYRTYHTGKWHIDGKPLQNGFDRSWEIGGGQNNFFSAAGITEDEQPTQQTPDYYVTVAAADHAIRCLREHAERFSNQPFFHYLAFTAPHFPLHAPAADIARYRDRYRQGWNVIAAERHARLLELGLVTHARPEMEREVGPPYAFPDAIAKLGPNEVNRPIPWSELNDAQREFQASKMAIHAAMVDRMDREIGRVIAQLKAMNAFENTLVLFISDNGASAEMMVRGGGHDPAAPMGSAATYLSLGPGWSSAANTPFRRHKTWVHEGGIATPFIAHWPAGIAARGEVRHAPAHLIDIVPTLLELTGAAMPETLAGVSIPASPGRSLKEIFAADRAADSRELWWEHDDHRGIRAGDWKLVALARGPWELYDLSKDRGESRNLAETQPVRAKELEVRWMRQRDENRRLALTDLPPDPPPAKKKATSPK